MQKLEIRTKNIKLENCFVKSVCLLIVYFMLMFSLLVSAHGESGPGNLNIVGLHGKDGKQLSNVTVTVYKADDMEPVKNGPSFNQDDVESSKALADELHKYVLKEKPEPYLKETTGSGSLKIDGLSDGLYLIIFDTDNEGVKIVPSLVGIPYYEDGIHGSYTLKMEPKIEYLENDKPSGDESKGKESSKKKSGDTKTNDPYRIGIYLGLMTISLGMILLSEKSIRRWRFET